MSLFDDGEAAARWSKLTLFADSSKGGRKQWSIWMNADNLTINVEWGLVGMKLQTSQDTAKPKKFKPAEEVAIDNYNRLIKKKREEGYREANEVSVVEDWLDALTKNFVPAKPIADTPQEVLEQMDKDGELIIERKRDGRRHLTLIRKSGWVRIYSRRMEELTNHLPLIQSAIEKLDLPGGTILDGEIIVDHKGHDDYRATGKFTNPATLPEDAAATAKTLHVRYMVFDVLWWNGEPVWQRPYEERYNLLQGVISTSGPIVFRAPIIRLPLALAIAQARSEGWEGLVCWEKDKGTIVRSGGQPKRINCHKWKPKMERDFIATGYYTGKGDCSNVVAGIYLADINPTTGERRDCGKCGSGFDDETRREALTWNYPVVVQLEFDRQEPTAKLRFPIFIRLHGDKAVDECIGLELSTDE